MNERKWLNRRAFLQGGTLFVAGSALLPNEAAADEDAKPRPRLGLVADLHYADKKASGTRYYRESLAKFAEIANRMGQEKPDFIVCLGDVIDSGASLEADKGHLRRMAGEFAKIHARRHYVLGNHCVENLTKPEFLGIVRQARSYYSFDAAGYHFIILDACFTSDGAPYGRRNFKWADAELPPVQLDWLRADLAETSHRTLVFVHQCLDVIPPFGVKNGPAVRKILEESGKVLGVIQGHYHWGNYQRLGGVHYCTLSAVVEGSGATNNAYAVLDLLPGNQIRIRGFRKQQSYRWA
jgi:alkaline phosphatase